MKRKLILVAVLAVLMILTTTAVFAVPGNNDSKGFDEYGYNNNANLFNGTGGSWYIAKFGGTIEDAEDYFDNSGLGNPLYAYDKLVMKWNDEWTRGNAGADGDPATKPNWDDPPYDAWDTNHWNGRVPGGSGEIYDFKCIWVGPELENSDYWREGGYPIWGQFEVIFEKYQYAGDPTEWLAHVMPAGLGGILN